MLNEEILKRFNQSMSEAINCDPAAMTLATVDDRGRPTQRVIMLLSIDERGLVFYTNSESRKGRHFEQHPYASACFYWHSLHQQVEFDGYVETIEPSEADKHWHNRERDSQISAWASRQSAPLQNRDQLLQRVREVKARYRDVLIPREPHWQAYRLIPERVEFWKSGWHRLHERVCFEYRDSNWEKGLLNP